MLLRAKHKILLLAVVTLGFCAQTNASSYNLNFNSDKYEKQSLEYEGKKIEVRAYEHIVYVANPVDTAVQVMNIYIPEQYFKNKSVNGYTAKTAPIFFPNQIGGYMEAQPATAKPSARVGGFQPGRNADGQGPAFMGNGDNKGMPPAGAGRPDGFGAPQSQRESAVLMALSKGYIVASPGVRGRKTAAEDGTFTGKAPAAIVDLKAAVRYLKYNDQRMPGDANKIISNGTSAGGAMSTLLGATGNNPDYEPYLKKLGAAPATDDVFAVSAFCPITNLDHADMAYEWQFNGINTYQNRMGGPSNAANGVNALTAQQIAVSDTLKNMFPDYVNYLQLKDANGNKLMLDASGNGTFKDLIKSYLIASAQKALDAGADLSKFTQLTVQNGKIVDIDWQAHIQYMGRMKTPTAFDGLNLGTGENEEFGTETIATQHFTDFAEKNTTTPATQADTKIVKMMNPMYYVGDAQTNTAPHWRIRHGTNDKDTGLAVSVMLATLLQNKGYDVNMELAWDRPHSGDYDLNDLFEWADKLAKK